jgi:hypothetical protein
MSIGVDDLRVEELLQQDPGETYVDMADVSVFVGIAGDPLVTADDLLGFPGVGFDQQSQITRGLMHVQAKGMGNRLLVHGRTPKDSLVAVGFMLFGSVLAWL